ncbi:pirin family protein [Aquimarina sp. 2201CG5-10]|uniref:pirin family protein n=1 Tax=Aquimarina callyspongiae TaxID=3098150 RepID=UPI002AB365FE|nr:pirin family protein [Aquimarina sp. 2201CG5-10]MDY8134338.1 pirin family protein [Aquimarina sp. 2201CG5-10]
MIVKNSLDQRRLFGGDKFQIESTLPGINMNNPDDIGLVQLGRVDYSYIKKGFVVSMHPHKNDEILSYIRKGRMTHEDSTGNLIPIHNTYMMMMNAGSGILHEETVVDVGEDVEMLQIFIRPEKDDIEPSVQFYDFKEEYSINNWRLIAGYKEENTPLVINSKIKVFDNHLTKNTTLQVNKGKTGLLYVFDGDIKINNTVSLTKGESLVLDEDLSIELLNRSADLVYFELDQNAPFSRSGPYSGLT